ncbi:MULTISPECIES: hypothetical protein [Pseudomonas]|jgi:hypothetical protein|uniref:Uncharacterized protein n=1 Tax=Pseudomonas putida TaxID=303 RepID=A0A9X8EF78_PSEPU|nr:MULTISPECIES: hypothetical protein [Pseudomonas]KTC25003.1 hypothetical protein AO392_12190 [Pseudomonas putida]MBG8558940.1 hypothetical protein [Pseudomonas qingdaonensis]MCO7504289.1 hypothetical protein [Pseudomonas sp. VE 267-6A]MCO7529499.1 hypothetical protein [Pseudomonas sp. 2]MCQ0167407.1 hypothetical protein [Pseudomonas sp. S12(2018)]
MKTSLTLAITLLYASLACAQDMSQQIAQPLKYASLEEMNLGEFVQQSRYASTLSALRMDSEAGDANATLDLLEALTGNKDLKPQDLDAVKQLLEIAAVQKADGARLQAMTARYSALKTQGVAVSTTPARPALTLDYSGDSLDDISGVKGCGDAQTAQTTACFAAFNKALKADYTALKQYNLALGWSAQRFQPDALQAKASKACGRFDYCPTTTLYVMNQTLLHETNEVRFPKTYEQAVYQLLTVPVATVQRTQKANYEKAVQANFEQARQQRYAYRERAGQSADALVIYALRMDAVILERPNCTAFANQAYEMAFNVHNRVVAESELDRINRSIVQTQCTLR